MKKIGNGLEHLVSLEEVYLSENKIEKIEGISTLKNLLIFDIGKNRVKKLEGLEELP